jgi:hypothetical protein
MFESAWDISNAFSKMKANEHEMELIIAWLRVELTPPL